MGKLYTQKTAFLFTVLLLLSTYKVFAAPVTTWNNSSGDGKWSTASNWSNGTVPVSGNVSIPNMSGATVYLDTTITIGSLTMTGNAILSIGAGKTLTITQTGNTLALNTAVSVKAVINMNSGNIISSGNITGTGIINGGSGTITIKSGVNSNITFNPGTGTAIIAGSSTQSSINITNFNNLQVNNTNGFTLSNDITVSGNLSGAGKITAFNRTINLSGNMTIATFAYNQSKIKLVGSTMQYINGYTFYTLENDNNAGTTLNGDATINVELKFDPSGGPGAYTNPSYLFLNGHTLAIASLAPVTSPSETNGFIVMGSTGYLQMYAEPGGFIFPFGPTAASYTPITVTVGSTMQFNATVTNSITNYSLNNVTKHSVNATWMVTPASDVASFSATLQWKASAQELPSFDRSNMYLYYRNDQSTPTAWNQIGAMTSASGSDPYTISTGTISLTGGTPFYLAAADNNIALPVELISFDVHPDNGKNILEWKTASEINNDYFEIQRSTDSKNWTSIGDKPGQGTTNTEELYSFIDASTNALASNVIYYRLKQVDNNGKFEYSEIRKISTSQTENYFKLYPNPAKDILNISLVHDGPIGTISIFDMQGICVYSTTSTSFQKQIDVKSLNSGMYILKTYSGNDVSAQVFCKE